MYKSLDANCASDVHSVAMHLSEYMAERGLTDEQVAEAIGKNRVSVSRYRRGIERPSSATIEDIFKWSGGQVAPNDWFDPIDPAPTESQPCEAAQ